MFSPSYLQCDLIRLWNYLAQLNADLELLQHPVHNGSLHVERCPDLDLRAVTVHSPDACQGLGVNDLRTAESVMTEGGVGKSGVAAQRWGRGASLERWEIGEASDKTLPAWRATQISRLSVTETRIELNTGPPPGPGSSGGRLQMSIPPSIHHSSIQLVHHRTHSTH